MADKEINLSKLKDEIHSRKQAKGSGDADVNQGTAAKDEFLNGLVESLNSGQRSKSTELIRAVDSKASGDESQAISEGSSNNTVGAELDKFSGNKTPQSNTAPPTPPSNTGGEDRDHKLFEEYEKKKKELFGNKFNQTAPTSPQPQQQSQQPQQLNEEKIYEVVNNVISEKFATVVEQAMKDSIVEIYSAARMKEVLDENKDTIRKIVIDVIKELQSKKKKT